MLQVQKTQFGGITFIAKLIKIKEKNKAGNNSSSSLRKNG